MGGFGLDVAVDVDVPVDDFNRVAGAPDESFDKVLSGIGGVFEDDDVPDFGIGELVEVFEDHDAVAAADSSELVGVGLMAAEQAFGRPVGAESIWNQR